MKRRILAAMIAALFGVVATPTVAQNSESSPAATAPMMSTPKPKTPAAGTLEVRVINWRNADLIELQAAKSGSAKWKRVLGDLKAGQWAWAKVPQRNNCRVDLRGKYADGQSADASSVEVCADKTVNLTN
jgi:hypothetical protein